MPQLPSNRRMRPRRLWPVAVAALAVSFAATTFSAAPPLGLAALLDQYSAGAFDEAVGTVEKAGEEAGQALRLQWPFEGRQWIDATPDGRPARLLAAAAFALETENVRAEHGDIFGYRSSACALGCVLN